MKISNIFQKRKIIKALVVRQMESPFADPLNNLFFVVIIVHFKSYFSFTYLDLLLRELFSQRVFLIDLVHNKSISKMVFFGGSVYPFTHQYNRILLETGESYEVVK